MRTVTPRATLEDRLEALRTGETVAEVTASAAVAATRAYRFIRPLSASYEGVVEALENHGDRFRLGLMELDALTRGFGPKELIFFTGFAHSGKTQLVNQAIENNRNKRILFFSLDDPAEMILVKLACMHAGVSADELERRVRRGDESAKQILRGSAIDTFRNLIVCDESLGLAGMDKAVEEATDFWGSPPDCVVIDYLELIGGGEDDADNVKNIANRLKRWVKDKPFPTIVLHQGTRSRSAPGEPITMLSMAYGGEQQGTCILGVRRKRDNDALEPWERRQHRNTITIHIVKNKRPPNRMTSKEGIDFFLDPNTGVIRDLRDGDLLPAAEQPLTHMHEAAAAKRSAAAAVDAETGEVHE